MSSDCISANLSREIPSTKVYEDEYVYAFDDIEPGLHVLVVPRRTTTSLTAKCPQKALGHIMAAIPKVAKIKGVDESGFRCIINVGRFRSDGAAYARARHRRRQDGSCHLRRFLARISLTLRLSLGHVAVRATIPLPLFPHLRYHVPSMRAWWWRHPCLQGPHTHIPCPMCHRASTLPRTELVFEETGLAYDVQGKAPTSQQGGARGRRGLVATIVVWALLGFGVAQTGIVVFSTPLWIITGCFSTFVFAVVLSFVMAKFVMHDVGLDDNDGKEPMMEGNPLTSSPCSSFLLVTFAVVMRINRRVAVEGKSFVPEYFIGSRSLGGFVLAMTTIATYGSVSSFVGGSRSGMVCWLGLGVYMSAVQVTALFLLFGISARSWPSSAARSGPSPSSTCCAHATSRTPSPTSRLSSSCSSSRR